MPTHALTSSANLLKQLQPPLSVTNSIPTPAYDQEASTLQDKLTQIASQPTNLGYGCGVALGKAIESAEALCKSLRKHLKNSKPGFLDFLFSNNPIHTIANDLHTQTQISKMIDQCNAHESALKKLNK